MLDQLPLLARLWKVHETLILTFNADQQQGCEGYTAAIPLGIVGAFVVENSLHYDESK